MISITQMCFVDVVFLRSGFIEKPHKDYAYIEVFYIFIVSEQ